jgi:ribosomal protein L7Ae-like RNA K-turn-binding protein
LNLLGLAARAGEILTGTDQVRKAVREGKVYYVMVAADASPTQQQKLVPLLDARQTRYHIRFSREQLGSAVGRAPISAVGVSNPSFARRVAEIVAALPSLQD